MSIVNDSGLEVLRKAAIAVTPTEYKIRTEAEFSGTIGDVNIKAPTGPFEITVGTATSTAANPLPVPLTGRVSLAIRNRSDDTTIYFGKNALVTADDSSTGGWEIGPASDFNLDINEDTAFYLITPALTTAIYKIIEVAST